MEEQTNKTTGIMTTTGLMDTGNNDSNSRNVINTLSNKKLVAKTGKEATTRITDTGTNHIQHSHSACILQTTEHLTTTLWQPLNCWNLDLNNITCFLA